MAYETIIVETKGRVGLVKLNRPQALNALNAQVIEELSVALDAFESDDGIGCIVITGSERAFAAGADISAMAKYDFNDTYGGDFITRQTYFPVLADEFAVRANQRRRVMNEMFVPLDQARNDVKIVMAQMAITGSSMATKTRIRYRALPSERFAVSRQATGSSSGSAAVSPTNVLPLVTGLSFSRRNIWSSTLKTRSTTLPDGINARRTMNARARPRQTAHSTRTRAECAIIGANPAPPPPRGSKNAGPKDGTKNRSLRPYDPPQFRANC
jgi:hypothetical protein